MDREEQRAIQHKKLAEIGIDSRELSNRIFVTTMCDLSDRLTELTAENARLRQQVEQLAGLAEHAYDSVDSYFGIDFEESKIKQRLDEIIGKEGDNGAEK